MIDLGEMFALNDGIEEQRGRGRDRGIDGERLWGGRVRGGHASP